MIVFTLLVSTLYIILLIRYMSIRGIGGEKQERRFMYLVLFTLVMLIIMTLQAITIQDLKNKTQGLPKLEKIKDAYRIKK